MTTEHFKCPRRGEWGRQASDDVDNWRGGTSFAGHEDDAAFHHCGYCGSINPDEFIAKIREGWAVIPTDKSYKAYLAEPCEPYMLLGTIEIKHREVGKFYYQHLSEVQRVEFVNLLNDHTMIVGEPGYFYKLPFFVAPPEERHGPHH